jgi:hypothetical protein
LPVGPKHPTGTIIHSSKTRSGGFIPPIAKPSFDFAQDEM